LLLSDAPWLEEGPLARVLALLDRDGEEARLVGGAVRNALLGEPIHEFDVATTAAPVEVERRAAEVGFKSVPTGVDHGTVTVVVEGHPIEVTTLREDVETYGRKAKVAFGRNWRADAERRDFTINALSLSRDGRVHDYVGGLADLEARRVRFIGDPARRIAEDFLRILRFFRFHAAYGRGAIDAAGLHAAVVAREGLRGLSRERVGAELRKLLVARRGAETVALMSDYGFLTDVLGGMAYVPIFAKLTELEQALMLEADPIRRLGAVSLWVADDAERIASRLRLANHERDRLAAMTTGWWQLSDEIGEPDAKALLYRVKPQAFRDRVLFAWAHAAQAPESTEWKRVLSLPERWIAPEFPIRAADFLTRGVVEGPAVGHALRAAEGLWVAEVFPMDAPTLSRIVAQALAAVER
jgi:poly(A) polymerase